MVTKSDPGSNKSRRAAASGTAATTEASVSRAAALAVQTLLEKLRLLDELLSRTTLSGQGNFMCNASMTRFFLRFAGSIVAACLLVLGGCTTFSAPYEYTVVSSAGTPMRPVEQLVLPPGAVVGSKAVTFVVEHGDASLSCLRTPQISDEAFPGRISSVYWRDISKRGTRIDVDRTKFACEMDEGLRECMRKAGASAMAAIKARPEWVGCVPPTTSMEESIPYETRESMKEDLGFFFVTRSRDRATLDLIDVTTVASESSPGTALTKVTAKVSVFPGQVSSVNLRPGMKVCVQAEHSLTSDSSNRARQASPEHCARFVDGLGDLLAFPRIDQLVSTVYAPLLNAHTTPAIYGVHEWSGIRSHAVESLGNTFQLTVYFPRVQAMNHQWVSIGSVFMIKDGGTTQAGPLVLLSGTERIVPPGRQVKLAELCGPGKFSCFLFMDRPSVRITQDIRMDDQVLEAELGMTLGELAASKSLPPVELSRPFRGRPIPVKGEADKVPLVRGDVLRRHHD